MPGFIDTAEPVSAFTNAALPVLPSTIETVSALRTKGFSLLNAPAHTRPCQRLTPLLADDGP